METSVIVSANGARERISITRIAFEEATSAILDKTISKTDEVVDTALSSGQKVDTILLVGGYSKMPQVYNALLQRYGIRPGMLDSAFAVAKGAALYAGNLKKSN